MSNIIKRSDLEIIINLLKDSHGKEISEKLSLHIKSLEALLKEKNKRILELTSLIKRFRTEFIKAQTESDLYKRNSDYFENIAKDYGIEFDLSFDEEAEVLGPDNEIS